MCVTDCICAKVFIALHANVTYSECSAKKKIALDNYTSLYDFILICSLNISFCQKRIFALSFAYKVKVTKWQKNSNFMILNILQIRFKCWKKTLKFEVRYRWNECYKSFWIHCKYVDVCRTYKKNSNNVSGTLRKTLKHSRRHTVINFQLFTLVSFFWYCHNYWGLQNKVELNLGACTFAYPLDSNYKIFWKAL